MNRRGLTRRQMLAGLGAAALATPLLPFVDEAHAAPGEIVRPTKLVLIYHPNGLELGWQPDVQGSEFALSPVLSALEPHRNRLVVINGLQGVYHGIITAHNEGMIGMWTGSTNAGGREYSAYPSIDQIVAQRIGVGTPFRSLEFGVQTKGSGLLGGSDNTSVMSYAGADQPIPAEDDPNAMYRRLFAGAGGGGAELEKIRKERRSVLDFLSGRLARVKAAYGADEQVKLDKHLEAIRDVERRLDGLASLTCNPSYTEHALSSTELQTDRNFPLIADLQADLLVLALSCGVTRVASLQYTQSISNARIPGANDGMGLHGVMHTGLKQQRVLINQWFVGRYAALLGKLAAADLGGGRTLLDETLTVFGTEMAIGNHLNHPIPFILAGGDLERGYFQQGNYFDFDNRPRTTKLLVSILRAMGIGDVNVVGDLDDASSVGPLERISVEV